MRRDQRSAANYRWMCCRPRWTNTAGRYPHHTANDGHPPALAEVERRHVRDVLRRAGGNKAKAPHLLAIE